MKKLNDQDLMSVTGGMYDGWKEDLQKAMIKIENDEYGKGKFKLAFYLSLADTKSAKNSEEFWDMVNKIVTSYAVNNHPTYGH